MLEISNRGAARSFRRLADLLEIRGEAVFKLAAYRRAAETLEALPEPIAAVHARGELERLPGVGRAIAQKLGELVETGSFRLLDEVQREIPPGVADLLAVPEIGPKRARLLFRELGVDGLDALRAAVADGRLDGVRGLGARGAERIAEGLRALPVGCGRIPLGRARPEALELAAALRALPGVLLAEPVGSVRRFAETVGDLDLAAATNEPEAVLAGFEALPQVARVLERDARGSRVALNSDTEAHLGVAPPERYGALLVLMTGSGPHLDGLRALALDRGLELGADALAGPDGPLPTPDEAAVYAALGLPPIPPPMREGGGELEATRRGALPPAFEAGWLRGDLHMHTVWSDGERSVREMALAARARGYAYICITDHSVGLGVANGLGPERLERQRVEIDAANAELAPFRVLQGVEVEVRGDGALDLPDDALARLDLVTASVHSGLRRGREAVTARALAAIRHPLVDVLAHPTGRLVGGRTGGDFDMDALYREAARTGTALEINGDAARLDLRDEHAAAAVAAGCVLTIGSDAHRAEGLANVEYGAAVATRARLLRGDVLNTLPLAELGARLKRARAGLARGSVHHP